MQVLSDGRPVTHVFHVADLHVSTDSERIPEYEQVFDSLLEELRGHPATRDGTALLVIAGDVLHNKCRASTDGARLLFDFVNRCLRAFPVLVICGNHDFRQDEPRITDAIEMLVAPYASQGTPHPIHYLRHTGLYRWSNVGFGVVAVKDTLRQRNTSGLVDDLPDYPSPRAFGGDVDCRVALFHGTVCRSLVSEGLPGFALAGSYPLSWFEGYDVGMFGDNHAQQTAVEDDMRPPLAWGYPGSLVQQTFGESLYGHGYIEWDVRAKSGTARHIPNDRGRVTMTRSEDGAWMATTGGAGSRPVALSEAVSSGRIPRLALVRSSAGLAASEEALRRAGAPRATVVPFSQGRGPPAPSSGPGGGEGCGVEDINSPEAWARFLKDSGFEVDAETRGWLAGDGLQVPRRFEGAVGVDLAACNSDICKLADDFSSTAAPRRKRDVRLLRLEWSWLLCFGPDNYFDFELIDGRVALLNGPNASGKSSFLDVLCAAMFGDLTSGRSDVCPCPDDVMCNVRPPNARAFAALGIEVDGDRYEIRRGFAAGKRGRTAVVRRERPGGRLEVEAEGAVKVREFVTRVLGTAAGVLSSSIVQQMDNASFFYQKPAHRRETVEAALNIDATNRYEALLKRSVSAHSRALASCEALLREAAGAGAGAGGEGGGEGEGDAEAAAAAARGEMKRVAAAMAEVSAAAAEAMRGVDPEAAAEAAARRAGVESGALEAELSGIRGELARADYDPGELAGVPSRAAALRAETEELGERRPEDGGAGDLPRLAEMSLELDARRPRDVDDSQADGDEAWGRRHASLLGLGDAGAARLADALEARRREAAERRDALMGTSFLREHVGDPDAGVAFCESAAWALKRRLEGLEDNRPDERMSDPPDPHRLIAEHGRWLERFPGEWTRDASGSAARAALEAAESASRELKREVDVLSGREDRDDGGEHRRLTELRRAASAAEAAAAGVGGKEHRAHRRRAARRAEAEEKLGGRTVDDLNQEMIRTAVAINGLETLRMRVQTLREVADAALDINPQCASCLNRESYRQQLRAREELALCERELAGLPDGEAERLGGERERLSDLLGVARRLAADARQHREDSERWASAERAHAEVRDAAEELRALEAAASVRAAAAEGELAAASETADLARRYLAPEAEERRAAAAGARWAADRREATAAIRRQAAAWAREVARADAELARADEERDLLRTFAAGREGWERRREGVAALRSWRAERERMDARLSAAERGRRFERALAEGEALERLGRVRDLAASLELGEMVLAHRKWRALESDRERLMAESNRLAAAAAVAEERMAVRRKTIARTTLLRDSHGELLLRRAKLKRLFDAFTSCDGSGGFKSWLYRHRVAPFLEREVNAFVREIDSFRIRVSVRKADDLAFRIEDRGSSPSLDHASGYQKFVLSLAMRTALGRIGAAGHNLKTLFVDEGFTAFDAGNMKKARAVLDALVRLGGYRSVLLVSHLEMVREAADVSVQVERRPRDPVSRIRFGAPQCK